MLSAGGVFNFNPILTFTPRSIFANTNVTPDSIFTDIMESDAGWNLLGNPTASPLYWDPNSNVWQRTKVDATVYIWDPAMNAHVGGYRFWNGQTGNYLDTIGSAAIIRPFQAFWVHASGVNPLLTFHADAKRPPASVLALARQKDPIQIDLTFSIDGMQSTGFITFDERAKLGRDEWDAYFLPPQGEDWITLYSLSAPGHTWPLSVNCLPITSNGYRSIPLFVDAGRLGQSLSGKNAKISWNLSGNWPEGWHPMLMDHQTRQVFPMRGATEYRIESLGAKSSKQNTHLEVNPALSMLRMPIPNQIRSNRRPSRGDSHPNSRWPYSIVIVESVHEPEYTYRPDLPELFAPFPNPAQSRIWFRYFLPDSAEVQLEVCDLKGKVVWKSPEIIGTPGVSSFLFESPGMSSGMYLVRLRANEQFTVQRFILTD